MATQAISERVQDSGCPGVSGRRDQPRSGGSEAQHRSGSAGSLAEAV